MGVRAGRDAWQRWERKELVLKVLTLEKAVYEGGW